MRFVMALGVVALGAGCAHAPKPADPAARAQQLSADAEQAYEALDFERCAERFRASGEASGEGPDRADSLYRAAGCASLAGHTDAAVEVLKQAVQGGYFDADHLEYNPELAALHTLPAWSGIVAEARANLSKAPEPPFPVMTLMGVDAFGSRKVDREAVQRVMGLELGKPIVHSAAVFKQKEAALREQYGLAYAHVGMSIYFADERKGTAYVVMDMVDAEDAARLRFLPEPKGHPADPEGLVARWDAYKERLNMLQMMGKLAEDSSCKVAHCIGGFGHPDLAAYEPEFLAKVPQQMDALSAVLREESDPGKRGAAASLMAYAPTAEETVKRLEPFIRDPDYGVRNNVLRVLTATQEAATKPLLDVATVADAVALPNSSDRNKATYLLTYLLADLPPEALKAQRAGLLRQLGERLVEMSALQIPINSEPAVLVLKQLSGEQYETAEEWRAWLARQPKTER
ncbi:HEAT repeat domain-containing protein [Corallococcus exiguus]|uniref:HEAT repeat domain-containing protein n=1 Tax=Corallococcus exiguus TaxID=83462 RepID=UPI001471D956|nr:HEAT repeat domain-containing protein [Corallococcus exiguus]NNC14797.1 HEAT repeat domain-containing protein [Corallococcus exiguus]